MSRDSKREVGSGRGEDGRRRARNTLKSNIGKVENGGQFGGTNKNLDERMLVHEVPTEAIWRTRGKQRGERKTMRAYVRSAEIVCLLCRVLSEVFATNMIDPLIPLGSTSASSIE